MKKNHLNRKGVALVIVLGMLALLMIITVAFAALMRQQQAGAANARHQSIAQRMVKIALWRAIDDINEVVGEEKMPNWPNGWTIVGTDASLPASRKWLPSGVTPQRNDWDYPNVIKGPEDVLFSVDRENPKRAPFNAFIMNAGMTNHLTVPFTRRIMQNDEELKDAASQATTMEQCLPEWRPIRDMSDSDSSKCNLLGRYCYVVLNTSSLLDAAETGGLIEEMGLKKAKPRGKGTLPDEIQLMGKTQTKANEGEVYLPELANMNPNKSGSQAIEFLKNRAEAILPRDNNNNNLRGRFDSLADFVQVVNKGKETLDPELLSSFRSFSRSLPEALPEKLTVAGKTIHNKIRIEAPPPPPGVNYSQWVESNPAKGKIIEAFKKTIYTGGLADHYGLKTDPDPEGELATRAYYSLCDMMAPKSEWEKPPSGNSTARQYQRPTMRPIPLPLNFGMQMLLTKKEHKDTSGTVTNITLYARYRMFSQFVSHWQDQNGEAIQPPVVDAVFDFMQGKPSGKFTELFLLEACGGEFEPVTEEINGKETSVWFNPNKGKGKTGDWSEPVSKDYKPSDSDLDNIEINQFVYFKINVNNKSKVPLAMRPALSNGIGIENGRMKFYANCKFEKDKILKEDMFLSIDDPMMVEEASRKCWSEAVDPRSAWFDIRHWIAHDDGNGKGNHTIPTLVAFAEEIKESIPNYADDALTMGGIGWFGYKVLQEKKPQYLKKDFLKIFPGFTLQVDGNHKGNNLDPLSSYLKWYVRNDTVGGLQSVGELGMLPLAPFFTITLYDTHSDNEFGWLPKFNEKRKWSTRDDQLPVFHRVLDYFTLEDENQPTRGKINLASSYRIYKNNDVIAAPALAAVFAGLPIYTDPNKPSSDPNKIKRVPIGRPSILDGQDKLENCSDLGARLAKVQADLQQPAKKDTIKYISDLAALFENDDIMYTGSTPSSTDKTMAGFVQKIMGTDSLGKQIKFGEWEREALIANSADLFTLRDQTFVILLRADAFTTGFGHQDIQKGSTLGTAYAIAEVWRDPEPMKRNDGSVITDGNGTTGNPLHPIRVQSFRILE